jgi:hypothetical protein
MRPSTPVWDSSTPEYRAAVERVDETNPADPEALAIVLAIERRFDTLPLWNLLDHPDLDARGRIFDRIADLVAPPREVTRRAILGGDRHAADLWRLRLDNFWKPW